MSVDISWETLTGGEDGRRMAENIRRFIDQKFQQIHLPRFIKSVAVRSFDFGDTVPEINIRDIGDPLPEFYEEEDQTGAESDDAGTSISNTVVEKDTIRPTLSGPANTAGPMQVRTQLPLAPQRTPFIQSDLFSPRLGASANAYFHLPLAPGLSGSTTPLAAVAGGRLPHGWGDAGPEFVGHSSQHIAHSRSLSSSSVSPPSSLDPSSRPTSQHQHDANVMTVTKAPEGCEHEESLFEPRAVDRNPNDLQVIAHVQYDGNVKMDLAAEIILDYPMQQFLGIPIELSITGLRFDGIAVIAYVKRKAHFCFFSPDDAESFLDPDQTDLHLGETSASKASRTIGPLEEIRVESEIGQREQGKQVLKNVGKVEKFILEQVRRIFEDEFIFPSFWTFLV